MLWVKKKGMVQELNNYTAIKAIVCPIYNNDGLDVSFRALALFTREEWLTDPYRNKLVKQFYTLVLNTIYHYHFRTNFASDGQRVVI